MCRLVSSDSRLRHRLIESAAAYIDLHHSPARERSLLNAVLDGMAPATAPDLQQQEMSAPGMPQATRLVNDGDSPVLAVS